MIFLYYIKLGYGMNAAPSTAQNDGRAHLEIQLSTFARRSETELSFWAQMNTTVTTGVAHGPVFK